MLEIIALIFLTRQIATIAERKGLNPKRWKLYTVLAWFAGELPALIIGILFFGPDNLVSVMLLGFAGAVTGYYILKINLQKKPDSFSDDINEIGRN